MRWLLEVAVVAVVLVGVGFALEDPSRPAVAATPTCPTVTGAYQAGLTDGLSGVEWGWTP